jgi:SAM-dependent methyltransferase
VGPGRAQLGRVGSGELGAAVRPLGPVNIPDKQLRILPDVEGLDVLDLGCGTGYWCAWLARLGARPVGLDVSEAQLETARALQREYDIEFPLLHASAESAPLPDRSFDLVFSEYGAAIWCDPYLWIPEAHRLLRPGGRLIFLCNSVLMILCSPPERRAGRRHAVRPQFGLHRIDWPDTQGPHFHLAHGDMLRLLRETGFDVDALHELRTPAGPEEDLRFTSAAAGPSAGRASRSGSRGAGPTDPSGR